MDYRKFIVEVIETLNEGLPEEEKISMAEDVCFLGSTSPFSSLLLIQFLVALEMKLASVGKTVSLTSLVDQDDTSPLASMSNLVAYLVA